MIYINAFIFCAVVCLIGEIILEHTSFTPGHLNTILVVIGSFLSVFGIYDKFITWAGAGATVPITNFGNLLVTGALTLYEEEGILGIGKGILTNASIGLSVTILISFIVSMLFKPKN